jgi:hypothetical protein
MRQAPRDRRDGPNPPGRFDRLRGAGPPAAATEPPLSKNLRDPRAVAQRWHDDTLAKTRTVVPETPHTRDLDGRLAAGFAPDTRCPAVTPGSGGRLLARQPGASTGTTTPPKSTTQPSRLITTVFTRSVPRAGNLIIAPFAACRLP